jgi:hypothetical protein
VDRHFAVFIALHAENVWQSNRNYLNISRKNIESFLITFEVPGGFLGKI